VLLLPTAFVTALPLKTACNGEKKDGELPAAGAPAIGESEGKVGARHHHGGGK